MANPMKGWKHARKPKRLEDAEGRRIIPLQKAPVWDEERGQWVAILSRKLKEHREKIPNVVGVQFGWEGVVYEAVAQSTISDTEKLRELNYNRRHETGLRAYFYVYLEEGDILLALRGGFGQVT